MATLLKIHPGHKPITQAFNISIKGILGGWTAFAGVHLFLNGASVRSWLTEKLGSEKRFMFLYSMAAGATLLPTVYFFWLGRKSGPYVSSLHKNQWVAPVSTFLKAAGGFALLQSIATPSPSGAFHGLNPYVTPMKPNAVYPEDQPHVQSIIRITRHPVYNAISMISLACLLKSPYLVDMLFWSFPVVFPYIAAVQQDSRLKKLRLLPASYFEHTSTIPFMAVLKGKQSFDQTFNETFTFGSIMMCAAFYVPFASFWRAHTKRFWTKLTI